MPKEYRVLSKSDRGKHYYIVEGRYNTKKEAKAAARKARGWKKVHGSPNAGKKEYVYARVFKTDKSGKYQYHYKATKGKKTRR